MILTPKSSGVLGPGMQGSCCPTLRKDGTRAWNGGGKWLPPPLQRLRCPGGVPCPVPGGWNRGQAVCRDCGGQWGRCLAAGLEMTEQPVCPGCQSGRTWWGRGMQRVFSQPWMFSLSASPSHCSPVLRQLTLSDGSEGAGTVPASRAPGSRDLLNPVLSPDEAANPFQWGTPWAAGCARVMKG